MQPTLLRYHYKHTEQYLCNVHLLCTDCYFTLFPTAIVLPSGLQQILMFSPLVFTTETHLLAAKQKMMA